MTTGPCIIGIDLGTTNSLCAVFRDGRAELIPNAHGEYLTPSVVGLLESGDLVVGAAARELSVTRPERTAACFKRWMGTDHALEVAGQEFSAQELSSLVLGSLRADAMAALGREIDEAVITVPAYFNEHQRQATRVAAELAGLRARRIVNEPTAAALAYGLVDKDEDKKLLVVDLGGGTFDVTLLEVFEGTIEIVATAGESHLGGEDFTDRVVEHCLRRVERVLEIAELKEPLRVSRLRGEVEHAKRALGEGSSASIRIPEPDGTIADDAPVVELDRGLFARIVEPLMRRLDPSLDRALQDGRTTAAELDEVILVGGATRMPLLREAMAAHFEREPRSSLDPDRVVALGAAVQSALITDDEAVEDLVMTDVCPFTLGISIAKEFGDQLRDGYFLPILHRNTTIPVSKEAFVQTIVANQREMRIEVYQGENRRAEGNLLLGTVSVEGIPPMKKGATVGVRFTYDLNGLLEVEAVIEETGEKFSALFTQNVRGLGEAEIARAAKKLQRLKFYPRDDLGNQRLLLFGERMVGQVGLFDRPQLEAILDVYETAFRGTDPAALEFAREQLLFELSRLGHPFDEAGAEDGEGPHGTDG